MSGDIRTEDLVSAANLAVMFRKNPDLEREVLNFLEDGKHEDLHDLVCFSMKQKGLDLNGNSRNVLNIAYRLTVSEDYLRNVTKAQYKLVQEILSE